MARTNERYKLLRLDTHTRALIPPLEAIDEGYNLIQCSKCGAVEDPSVYDGLLGYELIEHEECFDCYFEESNAAS